MNYYEELGLAPHAADEDIRRAHRTLSKVLHPDRQIDPAAREAAELQMRRLNAIVDTLLDPRRRREYDATLSAVPFPVVYVLPDERVAPARWRPGDPVSTLLLTVSAALVLTGAAVWFFGGDFLHFEAAGNHPAAPPEKGAPATPRPPPPAAHPGAHAVVTAARATHHLAEPPRSAARSGKTRQAVTSARVVRPRPSAAPPPLPVPAAPSAVAPAPAATVLTRQEEAPAVAAPTPTLAGLWLYVPDGRKDGPTRLYAPEYIQLRILAEDGALRGEYSARYQVLGRPISANVSFHFEGKAGGTSSFEWQSDDGSRGVVDLKMLTAESLQVNWRVSRFGTRMGLGAGTAVLIRKITVARRLREVAMVRAADESSRGQSRPRPNDAGWK